MSKLHDLLPVAGFHSTDLSDFVRNTDQFEALPPQAFHFPLMNLQTQTQTWSSMTLLTADLELVLLSS